MHSNIGFELPAPRSFFFTVTAFGFKSSPFGHGRGFGLPSAFRLNRGFFDERAQAFDRITPIFFLGTEPACIDDEHASFGDAFSRLLYQPLAYLLGQGRGSAHIES